MNLAKTLMVQGTASTVGKSTLVAGLCRLFAQDGWRVAPFKAQNMSLNAAVTRDGKEIGRAQAAQAEAAGIEPTAEMNPILLKPESNSRSQVIVMGRPLQAMEAQQYYQQRTHFITIVQQALTSLRQTYDLVIIEGAGSPVELNLAHYDLVNMRVARSANAPVLLVGDIDRGGIFASLLGTLMLLKPEERSLVKGLIVNKFRGDPALWRDGERMLAELGGMPVLGTLPFIDNLRLADEDSVALNEGTAYVLQPQLEPGQTPLEIVLMRLPYLSNYDEFDALAADPLVHLHVVANPNEFPAHPDLIILPGTKNTLSDLSWLWRQGLAQHIRLLAKQGSAVLGICGGYQMLGERLSDPHGAEATAGSVEPGLNLLPVETVFGLTSDKITRQSTAQIASSARRGLFASLQEHTFRVYQIHLGRTGMIGADSQANSSAFYVDGTGFDGWLSEDGWWTGCYLHGLFENDTFRHGLIEALIKRRTTSSAFTVKGTGFTRQDEYDRLADVLRQHLDLRQLKALCQLED